MNCFLSQFFSTFVIIQNERDNEEIGEKDNSPYDDIYKKRMRVKKGWNDFLFGKFLFTIKFFFFFDRESLVVYWYFVGKTRLKFIF